MLVTSKKKSDWVLHFGFVLTFFEVEIHQAAL